MSLEGVSLRDLLESNASQYGTTCWLTAPESGRKVTWADAAKQAAAIAAWLHNLGVRQGESVAVAAHNGIGSTLAFMGIVYGGYRATPMNLVAGAKIMAFVLGHSATRFVLVADDCRILLEEAVAESGRDDITLITLDTDKGPVNSTGNSAVSAVNDAALPPPPSPDTVGLLMYTSGTTGNPKGVMLSHANLIAAGRNVVLGHNISPADTALCVLPIYHINGLCVTVMGTVVSASGLVMPHRFSARRFWQQLHDHDCSWFSAVPTLFAYLLNDHEEPVIRRQRLRFARSASAPLSPEIHRKFEQRFDLPIIETMGLTETGAQILSNPLPPAPRKIGSPGVAVGNEIMIGDDDQQSVASGLTGEILVRGDNVMLGYLNQPEETAKTITSDGWLRTGDLGHMDEDGFVFVTGRIKELIIKGGENIAPREIDEVLLEHEAVLEAAAFAMPCHNYGQRVEACIRLKDGMEVSEAMLLQHCRNRLGDFKAPDHIHRLDDLPKGPSGKVQRMKLKPLVYPEE